MTPIHNAVQKHLNAWLNRMHYPDDFNQSAEEETFWAGARAMYKVLKQRRKYAARKRAAKNRSGNPPILGTGSNK